MEEQLASLQQRNQKLSAQAEVNREVVVKLQQQVDGLREQSSRFDETLLAVNRCAECPACDSPARIHMPSSTA